MTDQTGVDVTPAAEGVVDGQPTETHKDETRQVPLSVLKTVEGKLKETNSELERLREEAAEAKRLREQLELARANPPAYPHYQQQPPQPAQPAQEEPSFDFGDDDIIDGAKFKQILPTLASMLANKVNQSIGVDNIRQDLAHMRLAQRDPDYEATIKTYLPKLVNEDPGIKQVIQTSQDPMGTALALSLREKRMQEMSQQAPPETKPTTSFMDELTQIIENQGKPKSPSSAGSGAAAVTGADRFAHMTKEEFEAHKAKVLAGQLK